MLGNTAASGVSELPVGIIHSGWYRHRVLGAKVHRRTSLIEDHCAAAPQLSTAKITTAFEPTTKKNPLLQKHRTILVTITSSSSSMSKPENSNPIVLHRLVRCFGDARSVTLPGGIIPQVGPDRRTKSSFSSLSRLFGLKWLDASKPASSAQVKSRGLLLCVACERPLLRGCYMQVA